MQFIFRNKKREYSAAAVIIAIGFALRLYASSTVPLTHDEYENIAFVSEISFEKENLSLPLGSNITHNPPLMPYMIKLSTFLFGDNNIALRLPSVILGTLTLLVIFLLVRDNLNQKIALLTLIFISLSQFAIGFTRIAREDGILLFFASCVLLFTQKAINCQKKSFLWLTALFIGLGLLTKGTMITLLPIIILYIFFHSQNKDIFQKRSLPIFLLIIILINVPTIFWNIFNGYPNYIFYSNEADLLFFSLTPITLFLGEILVAGLYFIDDHMLRLITSYEYPFLSWLTGLISMIAGFYVLKIRKTKFITLLIWLYYFNFIFFMLIRPRSGGGYPIHFDNFWWATISVIPGFIFAAIMLYDLNKRYKHTKYLTLLIIFYMGINAIQFVNFPANCFIPRESIRKEELKLTAENYANSGKEDKALHVYQYMTKHYP